VVIQKGKDLVFFVTGTLMEEVIKATKIIKEEKGLTSTIIDIHTIKPLDIDLILKEVEGKEMVFTVEEHGIIGGLGAAISEILSESKKPVRVIRIGTIDKFVKVIGTRSYLRKQLGLDTEGIVKKVRQELL